jgi:hypothetical protein
LQSDAFEGKGIAGVETQRRSDTGDALYFLYRGGRAANLYADLCRVSAKAVTVDLRHVAARSPPRIGKNLQNLRAVAESIRRNGDPAILENEVRLTAPFVTLGASSPGFEQVRKQ